METLKVKSIFFSLLAFMAISVMTTSCQQDALEDLNPVVENEVQERTGRILVNLSTKVVGKWWHSQEENTYPITENIYRPDSYNFPPARGRKGLEFLPNGDFVYHYPGPTDIPMTTEGKWSMFGNSRIFIRFVQSPLGVSRWQTIKVNEVDVDKLVIEPLNW